MLRIFLYFAEAGAFVFGSGLAIVPFLPAPYFKRIAKNPWIAAFVEGVTAAATGAIAGAAIVLGQSRHQ